MKAILYAANTASQDVALNGIINFGNVVRRCGNNLNISNGALVTGGCGYTNISTNFTITAGAGTTTIALYKDGIPITGATASMTTVADSVYNVEIPVVIKDTRCCGSTITAVLSGAAGTITNAAITAERY